VKILLNLAYDENVPSDVKEDLKELVSNHNLISQIL